MDVVWLGIFMVSFSSSIALTCTVLPDFCRASTSAPFTTFTTTKTLYTFNEFTNKKITKTMEIFSGNMNRNNVA
jgi:hypothetical protein